MQKKWNLKIPLNYGGWGNSGKVSDFIFGGSKITADGDCSDEIKSRLLL